LNDARGMAESDAIGRAGRAWRLLLGRSDAPAAVRYGMAGALAAGAVAGGLLLPGNLHGYRVLLYSAAACLAALRGGTAPGLTALAICAFAYRASTGAVGSAVWLEEPDPVHRLLFFLAFAALGVWGASSLRDGYRHMYLRRRRAEARADTQRIAAELGVRALAESDLDALLGETLAAVKQALRCDAVTLLELMPDGNALRLRDAAGMGRELVGRMFGPAEAPLAFNALVAREPVAVFDLSAGGPLASPVLVQAGALASIVAPIVAPGPGGRSFGVLGAHTVVRRRFTVDETSFLQTAANVVGTAVVRVRAEERVRRALASERFLADASRQLALSIDWQQTVARVAKLAVPFLGDWALVVVVGPDGQPRTVVAEAADPARAAAARELLERYPIDVSAAHGVGRILRTGAPELIPEVTSDAFVGEDGGSSDLRREILRRLGMRSYMGAPLSIGERVLGAVAFGVADGPRRFGPEDLAVAQALAQRCAVALENASLYRAAQEATRVREEVLAVVSHDLKTPLGALLMGAQMVERLAAPGPPGDDLRRAAASVRRTAQRMGRLIHDLVDVASIEAGRLSVRVAECEASAVAREALEAVQGLAADRGIALSLAAVAAVPVPCDRDRVLQVLSNLLSNAIQVSETGGRVHVAVAAAEGEVVFTVSDTGPGIPVEDLPHVFERWYRGRRTRYPGSGLGLAIARAIVDAHRGRIWADSREGEGSAFSFSLPARSQAQSTATA
jgi:signal transduction histidine kinase